MDYIQTTQTQQQRMLEAIGVESLDGLFASLPPAYRIDRPLQVAGPLSELELQRTLADRSGRNRTALTHACFMGAGAYDHFVPSVVDTVAGRGEFLTAYTPYQAEASQGALQAFFEFQTQIARLAGLEVANASLYEGASSVTEAVFMAANVTGRRRVLIASTLHPHYLAVLETACSDLPLELVTLPADPRSGRVSASTVEDQVDADTAAVVVQSPNVVGLIEDWSGLFRAAGSGGPDGPLAVAVFNPIAAAWLKRPGSCGADIACAEGQPLGIPLQYGGPWLGLFATRQKLMRKMPGRLIGLTNDAEGRPAYCLTLQTREQHIRGAKATSNICTNQGLLALRATAYMTLLGPGGMRAVAEHCYHKAHHLSARIGALEGYELVHAQTPFFHEFLVRCPRPARELVAAGMEVGLLAGVAGPLLGLADERCLLVTVTEKRTRAEMDRLVDLLRSAA